MRRIEIRPRNEQTGNDARRSGRPGCLLDFANRSAWHRGGRSGGRYHGRSGGGSSRGSGRHSGRGGSGHRSRGGDRDGGNRSATEEIPYHIHAGAEGEFEHVQHEVKEGEGADDLEAEACIDRGSNGRRGVLHDVGKPRPEGTKSVLYCVCREVEGCDGEICLRVWRDATRPKPLCAVNVLREAGKKGGRHRKGKAGRVLRGSRKKKEVPRAKGTQDCGSR